MVTILAPAPSTDRSGARVLVRCDCGVEKVLRRKHVVSGQIKSCGCANLRVIAERRARAEERKRRKPEEMPELVTVPRLVPASKWMNDAVLIDELVALLNPPHGRLPYLAPTRVSEVCEALGCEPHHLRRWPLLMALEFDDEGERMHGRLIAAGDVFGNQLAARLGGRREAA